MHFDQYIFNRFSVIFFVITFENISIPKMVESDV